VPRREQQKKAKAGAQAAEEEAAHGAAPTPAVPKANQAKAKSTPQPATPPQAAPKPESKAKAKAAPKTAEVKVDSAPPPKVEAKASAKGKAKAAPKQAAKPEETDAEADARRKEDVNDFTAFDQYDDGTGGEWSCASGTTAKKAKQLEKKNEAKKIKDEEEKRGKIGAGQHVPGLTQSAGQYIPGMTQTAISKGTSQAVAATAAQIKAFEEQRAQQLAEAAVAASGQRSVSIEVPENAVGRVIGEKGKNIKLIQEKCEGVKIDTTGGEFTITGPDEGVNKASKAIKDIISKGYTELAYTDFEDSTVQVYPSNFPDLIGKKGATIILLKKELNVEVNFPDTKNAKQNKKIKVPLAGRKEDVDKAKEVIESIVKYGHHEITHPGEVHDEVEVEEWCYAAIIGKKGSELRHIQNCFKCRVMIPRETSECKNVVVVGDPVGVPKAKAYIERTVYNFATGQRGGRERGEQAQDDWGEEEPMEDWMKQYIYKR